MTALRKRPATSAAVYGKKRDRYMELVDQFPLRPIRTEDELDAATAVIHMLIDQPKLNPPEDDYLDVLSQLVMAYEAVHYPDEPVSDGDMLQSFLDDWRVSQADVAKAAGIAESTISEVLRGKRKLTRAQIGKLAKYFKVSPAVFDFDG